MDKRKGQETESSGDVLETEQSPDIRVKRGKVVAIGKLKVIPNQIFPWKIPTLSFVVIEMEPNYFVASCIHLWTDGYDDDINFAVESMRKRCQKFLHTIFNGEHKKDAWENLYDRFKTDTVTDDLRDAYYEAQLQLAKRGVGMGVETALKNRIDLLKIQISETKDMMKKQKELVELVKGLPLSKKTPMRVAELAVQDLKENSDNFFDIEEEILRL